MAIADYDEYQSRYNAPDQRIYWTKTGVGSRENKLVSTWQLGPTQWQGAVPSTAAVCDRTTVGGLQQLNPVVADKLRVLGAQLALSATQCQGFVMVADRLVHMGGLDATNTGAQTVNTPALTRYTSGVGVLAAVEIYTQIGASSTTFTVSYTNQASGSGRTSPATAIGNTDFREANVMLPIPLQLTDTGIQSVETVTLAATTGTAGNFGITLYKPIITFPAPVTKHAYNWDALFGAFAQFEPIINDACLWVLLFTDDNNLSSLSGSFALAED